MTGSVALYVPGSRPDRFEKAAATGADVILDLEDAVAPAEKYAAREAVVGWLPMSTVPVQVRVNRPGSPELGADLAVLPESVELRVPKVAAVEDLDVFGGRPVHVLIESARGVENISSIAAVDGVRTLTLGEADLRAELGFEDDEALDWIRSRVVVACAGAGLPAPLMAAYPDIKDRDGLVASCAHARRRGFRGRTAIHPSQVPIIRSAFAPPPEDLAWAREVVAIVEGGEGGGVGVLSDGSMVDAAMVRRARAILA